MKSIFPFAHTFSIAARDPKSGQMGVAVQSHWFSVGSLVAWGEAGVGVVATQSMVDVSYGPLGLSMMKAGKSPQSALMALLSTDENAALRQVAMVNSRGEVAVHTGSRCIAATGHCSGEGFSVQANMMKFDTVWSAMKAAYLNQQGDFADRLMAALLAAQAEGGDIRGKQSASILIVAAQSSGCAWKDIIMDLRVEDHASPLVELARLIKVQKAYNFMNAGDAFLAEEDTENALHAYQSALNSAPDNLEIQFWYALTLAQIGSLDQAVQIFKKVFALEPDWHLLLKRLPEASLLQMDETMQARLFSSLME